MVPVLLTGSLQYLWSVRGSALDDSDLARVVDWLIGPYAARERSKAKVDQGT